MKRPRKAVRVGVPILVVGLLALAALWRVGAPGGPTAGGSAPRPAPLAPLTRIAEVVAQNSAGRRASLEGVYVQAIPSERTAWIEADAHTVTGEHAPLFAVLDPDVKRPPGLRWEPGIRVTLIGLVRPSPDAATAIRQWHIDEPTADDLVTRGTYLHVTEIRPFAN